MESENEKQLLNYGLYMWQYNYFNWNINYLIQLGIDDKEYLVLI